MEMIIREKYLSNFHIYITNTDAEIDCISVRESCITGAIPLLSNHGVFVERSGLHFDLLETNQRSYIEIATKITPKRSIQFD